MPHQSVCKASGSRSISVAGLGKSRASSPGGTLPRSFSDLITAEWRSGRRVHASRLGLGNVAFDRADLETFVPPATTGLVTMFDAFNHVLNPEAFIASAAGGAPTEHRYTASDFERFFRGFSLDIRGTIAGLEQYGPDPGRRTRLRDRFGDAVYQLVAAIDDAMYEEGFDLAAKHWRSTRPTRRPQPARGARSAFRPRSPLPVVCSRRMGALQRVRGSG